MSLTRNDCKDKGIYGAMHEIEHTQDCSKVNNTAYKQFMDDIFKGTVSNKNRKIYLIRLRKWISINKLRKHM